MENEEGNLESRFAGLTVNDPYSINGNDGLFQVMKAVEAAEATIKQQVEENNRLRSELQKKNEELENYKPGYGKYQNYQSGGWAEHFNSPSRADQLVLQLENQLAGRNVAINSGHGMPDSVLQTDVSRSNRDHVMQMHVENQFDNNINGSLNMIHGDHASSDNSGVAQIISPSMTSTPSRNQLEGNLDPELRYSGRDLVSVADVNNNGSSKQDIVVQIREHEEEIAQLRKHLTEFSMKESQIRNEKYALDKRISYMRLAFDQQQQDLILAASKAISYRQDIMEENVRLTYALQATQQERSTFVTSLMPLLAEYSLQPPVADAQSIVSNVKVLFRHLQEQLLVTEGKVKESEYQLAPWRSDINSSTITQSPVYSHEIKKGLELVPQQTYSDGKMPSSDSQTTMDILGLPQSGLENLKNPEHELGRHPPLGSRNTAFPEIAQQIAYNQVDPQNVRNSEATVSKKVTFGDLVRSSESDEPENRGLLSDREPSANWNSNTASTTSMDDPNSSFSPFLPPVLEEPSSSFSEAADDDPLPAIDGLQISGEAFPGQQLQACGYSINGTTSCNFEWVRHLEDGSFRYVDGAKQPNYLITADDVDTYLAIEVQPLDDRKRKGELVKVFANEHRKITCDPEMQRCLERNLYAAQASYKISLSSGYLDIWEQATLTIKRDGYSIKGSGPNGTVVTEKFSSSTFVSIPYGSPTEFIIGDSQGTERMLRVESLADISGSRDTIVLTFRLFILKAGEKKRKKRSIFFSK
ncbi:uncharacterized protein LOC125222084 isoform X1 [Salvia hispanica]|uniref:uncharacterized protein LOC125222084 isoform X1 n=1 Tax=Salvia hispanica TaxID=49212 RepID=UPI002009A1E1|nr:uncharacterized protein LOC125222084 isoform X1 [Salvia hispanica]XP_047980483.1 uncharacterized protein LOC125222084 isoform X1 [Salvia hispanica]XP_047980490.1 uncharacterized protein LOC125222084 isoform X1 [Salvia hispanica]